MAALVIRPGRPIIEHGLQLFRRHLADDQRLAGVLARLFPQTLRFGDVVSAIACEHFGACPLEGAEYSLDMRFFLGASRRAGLVLDIKHLERGAHRLVDIARALVGQDLGRHGAPSQHGIGEDPPHGLGAFGSGDLKPNPARIDVDDAEDGHSAFGQNDVARSRVDFPALVRISQLPIGAAKCEAVDRLVTGGVMQARQDDCVFGFEAPDVPLQRPQIRCFAEMSTDHLVNHHGGKRALGEPSHNRLRDVWVFREEGTRTGRATHSPFGSICPFGRGTARRQIDLGVDR